MASTTLEARLQYLETREDAHTRDIIRLKTENAELHDKVMDLKTSVSALKREHWQTSERLMEAETRLKKAENESKMFCGFRESIEEIETKVKKIERDLKTVVGFQKTVEEAEIRLRTTEENVKTLFCFRENIVEIKNKLKTTENDFNTVFGFRKSIEGRLSCLESNMTMMKDCEERLNGLETVINIFRQEVASCTHPDSERSKGVTSGGDGSSSMAIDRVQKMENEMKISLKNVEKRLKKVESDVISTRQESARNFQSVTEKLKHAKGQMNDRVQKVENKLKGYDNVEKRLKKMETDAVSNRQEATGNQSLMDKIKLTERQVQDTEKIVRKLMETREYVWRSVTRVSLLPDYDIDMSEQYGRVKLDRCDSVRINGGYFNEHSGCFEPPVGGYYGIGVKFCHFRDGEISLYYRDTRQDVLILIGVSFRHEHVVSNTTVVWLDKGDQLWLEMEQEGDTSLGWCWFTAWLISPSEL